MRLEDVAVQRTLTLVAGNIGYRVTEITERNSRYFQLEVVIVADWWPE